VWKNRPVFMLPVSAKREAAKLVEPFNGPNVAVIVVAPAAILLARPALLIVATEVAEEAHVTEPVRS
jgi:hypothetical protein